MFRKKQANGTNPIYGASEQGILGTEQANMDFAFEGERLGFAGGGRDAGAGSNFAADLKIGSIMLGDFISWPTSPRMEVGFDIDYDGTDIVTSAGGNTYANTSYLGSPGWAKTNPWVLAPSSSENQVHKFPIPLQLKPQGIRCCAQLVDRDRLALR